jgi:hypothetical protein
MIVVVLYECQQLYSTENASGSIFNLRSEASFLISIDIAHHHPLSSPFRVGHSRFPYTPQSWQKYEQIKRLLRLSVQNDLK